MSAGFCDLCEIAPMDSTRGHCYGTNDCHCWCAGWPCDCEDDAVLPPPTFRIILTEGAIPAKQATELVTLLQQWITEVVFGADIEIRLNGNTIELTPRERRAI